MGVVDVTDPANAVTLSLTEYPPPDSGFPEPAGGSHQGWLLDGHRYYVHNTESTRRDPRGLDIFDLADLTDPEHIGFFENPAQDTISIGGAPLSVAEPPCHPGTPGGDFQ